MTTNQRRVAAWLLCIMVTRFIQLSYAFDDITTGKG